MVEANRCRATRPVTPRPTTKTVVGVRPTYHQNGGSTYHQNGHRSYHQNGGTTYHQNGGTREEHVRRTCEKRSMFASLTAAVVARQRGDLRLVTTRPTDGCRTRSLRSLACPVNATWLLWRPSHQSNSTPEVTNRPRARTSRHPLRCASAAGRCDSMSQGTVPRDVPSDRSRITHHRNDGQDENTTNGCVPLRAFVSRSRPQPHRETGSDRSTARTAAQTAVSGGDLDAT